MTIFKELLFLSIRIGLSNLFILFDLLKHAYHEESRVIMDLFRP